MLTPNQFQQQRNKMSDVYFETEKEFIDITRIIPLDNEPQTHSPRLYNIL